MGSVQVEFMPADYGIGNPVLTVTVVSVDGEISPDADPCSVLQEDIRFRILFLSPKTVKPKNALHGKRVVRGLALRRDSLLNLAQIVVDFTDLPGNWFRREHLRDLPGPE